jgi:uncharacterized membrane protein YkvI
LRTLAKRHGLWLAALLLVIGSFTPWAAHSTSALTLSAHELAVFTHATPGAGIFLNQWFHLPLWAAALLLALAAGRISGWLNRALAGMGCAALAALGLPGYPQVLTAFRSPDYRLEFWLSMVVMALAFTIAVLRVGQRPKTTRLAWLLLALISAVPLVGYLLVRPFIEQLYADTVGIGWGWWLTLLAVALSVAGVARLSVLQWRRAVTPVSPS